MIDASSVADEATSSEVPNISWDNPNDDGGEVETQGTPEGTLYTVKVNGEEIQVPLEEALQGYQRQSDYTQKTQELARQREELDHVSRLALALDVDPQKAIDAIAEAYGVGRVQQQQEPSEPLDPEEARIAAIEQQVAAFQQQNFEAQVNAQLAALHSQYGQFDDTELVQFAVQNGIGNLDVAAKAFVFDKVVTKATAEQAATAAKRTAPPVAGGHTVAPGAVAPAGNGGKPTLREALVSAWNEHTK